MAQLIVKKKIPPLRQIRYCCQELKERCGKGRFKLTGIRAEESPRRAKRPIIEENKSAKSFFLHPIKNWSTDDVWAYIHSRNLPYCSLYDEGFHRIGCVLCPFINYEQALFEMARYPAIADYYRRACRKSFSVNRDSLHSWSSGDDMFDWWINQRRRKFIAPDCDSIPLFSEDDGSVL